MELTELELSDEPEKVQYATPPTGSHSRHRTQLTRRRNRFKIGDAFFHIPLEDAQEMLTTQTTQIEEDTGALEDKLGSLHEEMTQLKVELYARFGKQINLET